MYKPKYAENTNEEEISAFIRENSFGILVNQGAGKLWATHIPLELGEDNTRLFGHISKANPQWKNFNSGEEVLAIFTGPHAYISSSWYDHENVPTWNYIAVHVYGKVRIIEGDELLATLKTLVDKYEKKSVNPVSIEKMSPDYLQRELRGIVGIEIAISSIDAAYKLSQNRDQKNHMAIVNELEKTNDPASLAIADVMKANPPKH